jgi:NAD(P)-dependent dehydrogenase (short-subunit alcohol dehydrogenase family)
MKIKDSVAVITGGAGGIGGALALELVKRGAAGVAVVDKSQAVENVARTLNDLGGAAVASPYSGDVTDPEFRRRVYQEMSQKHGPVNICVPAAGITRDSLAVKIDKANWR